MFAMLLLSISKQTLLIGELVNFLNFILMIDLEKGVRRDLIPHAHPDTPLLA